MHTGFRFLRLTFVPDVAALAADKALLRVDYGAQTRVTDAGQELAFPLGPFRLAAARLVGVRRGWRPGGGDPPGVHGTARVGWIQLRLCQRMIALQPAGGPSYERADAVSRARLNEEYRA